MACTTCNDGTCLTPETCERLRRNAKWPNGWRCPHCKTELRVRGKTPVSAPCKTCKAALRGR